MVIHPAAVWTSIALYLVGTLADWWTTSHGMKLGYTERNGVSAWLMQRVGVWFATLVPELTILFVLWRWAPPVIIVYACSVGGIGQLVAAYHNWKLLRADPRF